MHVEVISDGDTTDQVRAYAEYKVFVTLARLRRALSRVRASIGHFKNSDNEENVVCSVTVELDPSGTVHTRVRRPHPNDAINHAADQIGYLVERRRARRISS